MSNALSRSVSHLAFFALLIAMSVPCLSQGSSNPNPPNSNGQPGFWEPWIAHGPHLVACANTQSGQPDPNRFYPMHGIMLTVGDFRGWILLLEKNGQIPCRHFGAPPNQQDADADQRWAIFDPVNRTIHKFACRVNFVDSPPPPCNATLQGHQGFFCSGHCILPDGRIFFAGGEYWASAVPPPTVPPQPIPTACGTEFAGTRMLAVFDPRHISLQAGHEYQWLRSRTVRSGDVLERQLDPALGSVQRSHVPLDRAPSG